jgi:mono/diheme cytochrome c family protein
MVALKLMNSIRKPALRVALILALAANAAAQRVSYSKQVAPVFAMNCHLCHGANPESTAGGLSTRTWADLMKGGNLGPAIIAGDPEESALYQFVNGARGEAHRMPLGGPPLGVAEIELIRRWIAEGARNDSEETRRYRLTLPSVRLKHASPAPIRARVPSDGYIALEISDSRGARLYLDGGAVRSHRGVAAIGIPEQWIVWRLRRAPLWPAEVRVTLTISYSSSEPLNAELAVGPDARGGDGEIRIVSADTEQVALRGRGPHSVAQWQARVAPGIYYLHTRYRRTGSEFATLFRAQR